MSVVEATKCPKCGAPYPRKYYTEGAVVANFICMECYNSWHEKLEPKELMTKLVETLDNTISDMKDLMEETKSEDEALELSKIVDASDEMTSSLTNRIWDATSKAKWEEVKEDGSSK
jgi:uncharacterized Zn finger protein (UPF0148 family)